VALIHIEGMITGASASGGLLAVDSMASSLTVVEELYKARDDDNIKAVVLRINSPGGTAAASDEIYRAIDALSAEKPVVVSMGDVAASGGYYIASAADYIFANGATLTGSIGVVFNLLNFEELADNIGVEDTTLTAGEYKDIGSPWRAMTGDERSMMGEMLDEVHGQFISAVSAGRQDMSEEEVRAAANGMIYTGARALELKLVDEIGGLHEAKAKARELGGLPEDAVVEELKAPGGLFGELFGATGSAAAPGVVRWLDNIHPLLRLAGSMYLAPVGENALTY
jgi:protease-4